jgi:hypothetical protein
MALYQWPAVLPAPSSVFQASVSPDTIRSTLEHGATKQRNLFESESSFFNVTWDFTDNERKAFKGILKHELTNGADRFNIDLPANMGFETVTARIVEGRYSESYRGVLHWTISVTLECRDSPIWPIGAFEFLFWAEENGFTLEEFEIATQALYTLVNVTIPTTLPK